MAARRRAGRVVRRLNDRGVLRAMRAGGRVGRNERIARGVNRITMSRRGPGGRRQVRVFTAVGGRGTGGK